MRQGFACRWFTQERSQEQHLGGKQDWAEEGERQDTDALTGPRGNSKA